MYNQPKLSVVIFIVIALILPKLDFEINYKSSLFHMECLLMPLKPDWVYEFFFSMPSGLVSSLKLTFLVMSNKCCSFPISVLVGWE